jgi:type IV pilus assembly protein PilZ
MPTPGGNLRNGILNLALKDVNELYACYMPFIDGGGLFVRTRKEYRLGDQVFVLLDLLDEPEKTPLTGEIVWITPVGSGIRPQGIGIRLAADHADIVRRIEAELAGLQNSDRPTYTL